MSRPIRTCLSLLLCLLGSPILAQDARRADEALAEEFSFARGAEFLDAKAAEWGEARDCVTCHTNGLALMAQPIVSTDSEAVAQTRAFATKYLTSFLDGEAEPSGQRGSLTGLVATTAFLALSDARTGLGLQAATRRGLEHAWAVLDKSGTWEGWLKCNWPPFEVDNEFAPALMLVALGELRADESPTKLTQDDLKGAQQLQKWLRSNPPQNLHGKAMRIWAGNHWNGVAPTSRRSTWRKELGKAQEKDGGWSMASLAGPEWKRDGGAAQTSDSEAYPTAFALYVLLQSGSRRKENTIQRGLEWLRRNQRESGAWFTRSPRRDRKHYISHAATAFALMVLSEDEADRQDEP